MDEVGTGAADELEEEPTASQMAGKSPNFCVLLHGSLKVEGMVALVQLGWDAMSNITTPAENKYILWRNGLNEACFFPAPSGTACCTPKQTARRNQTWWCLCLSLVHSLYLGWAKFHIWDQYQVTPYCVWCLCRHISNKQTTFTTNIYVSLKQTPHKVFASS